MKNSGIESKLAWPCQGPSPNKGQRLDHGFVMDRYTNIAICRAQMELLREGKDPSPTEIRRQKHVFVRDRSTNPARYRTGEEACCPSQGQMAEHVIISKTSTDAATYRTGEEADAKATFLAPSEAQGSSMPSSGINQHIHQCTGVERKLRREDQGQNPS